MAGDPLRDAFRTRLRTHATAAGIAWPIKDLFNTTETPDATEFLDLEFPGGSEDQYTFGAPGSNLFREQGQVTLRVCTMLGAGVTKRDLAETYAAALRSKFRKDRFAAGAGTVRITSVAPMGGGHTEAGLWAEAVALGYEIFNIG
jgi:Bacteriophage related domain of unknown function